MARNNQILTGQARMIAPGEMVLDPGPRNPISIDTRSAVGAVESNPGSFARADLGRAKIGEAVGNVGSAMEQLALKQMEAINITRRAEAQNIMTESEAQIAEALAKERDETKWEGIASGITAKTKERIGKLSLSPVAKAAVDNDFGRWEAHRVSGVRVNSAEESIRKARALIGDRLKLAVEKQDSGAFEANLSGAVQGGYISPEAAEFSRIQFKEEGERQAKQAEVDQRNMIYETNLAAIQADPFKYEIPEGVTDPQIRDRLEREKRQYQAQASSDQSDGLSDRLASGEFKTLADLQAAFPDSMRPTVRKQFEGMFQRAQIPGIKAKMEADAPQNFARFSDAVESYDSAGDPEGIRYAQIVMSVKQAMPEELRGEILGPLYKKRPGADPQVIDAPEPLKTSVKDIVNTMFDAGALGKFKAPNPADPTKEIEDPKAKANAYAKKGSVMIAMQKWLSANPDATPDQAMEVVRSTIAGNAPSIRSTVPRSSPPEFKPSKATPVAPWETDLPDNPGGPSSDLIPFYLPADLQSE